MSTDDVDAPPVEDPDADIGELAREALLTAIHNQVKVAPNATTLLRLAEAYAWCVAPAQDHGDHEKT